MLPLLLIVFFPGTSLGQVPPVYLGGGGASLAPGGGVALQAMGLENSAAGSASSTASSDAGADCRADCDAAVTVGSAAPFWAYASGARPQLPRPSRARPRPKPSDRA